MAAQCPAPPTGSFPRVLSPTLLWAGGCLNVPYNGQIVHSHTSTFLILGEKKTLLVDTGNAADWPEVERSVVECLDGRPLDYIFPTHGELPHCGLLNQWMEKYPELLAVGPVRDFKLFLPRYADRMREVQPGESIELGEDRRFLFLPAVWRDLNETLWGFDTKERTLFVSDAFAYLHYHEEGACDYLTTEHPLPNVEMIRFFNERAMYWTRHTDARLSFKDIDELIAQLRPRLIATAHGGVIDDESEMLPLVKKGMDVRQLAEIGEDA